MTKHAFLLPGLVLAASLAAVPAAVAAKEVPSTRVYFADLDLRTDAGVETLDGRLRHAISRMCGGLPRGGAVAMLASQRCRAETLADITPRRDAVIRIARTEGSVRVTQLDLKKPARAN